jgi:hypothetical protein
MLSQRHESGGETPLHIRGHIGDINQLPGPIMHSLKRTFILVCLSIASAMALADPRQDYEQALVRWAQVLTQHVDEQGRVDFSAIAAQPAHLESYIEAVADYGPRTAPAQFNDAATVLAYHINTYNAQAMYGVIERGIPEGFDSFFKRTSFFRLRTVLIDGEETNLQNYENKVIRPLGEPRAHFVLNCMVRDCPRLPRKPFVAQSLAEDLEIATREFFQHPGKLHVEQGAQVVRLSAILDFYTEDFVASGKAADLPAYVNRYIDKPLPAGYRVKFFDYDWTINKQP